MLQELAGGVHQVVTGVHISKFDIDQLKYKERQFYIATDVEFDNISDDLLDIYLKSEDSLDKAGAYGIQGQALTFISKVNGSYSNVVGFPLSEFVDQLKDFLGYPNDQTGGWRKVFKG